MIKVLPSSNPEKEENLVNYARGLMDLSIEYLHCDVMDGIFVENKCLEFNTLKEVRNNTNILLDVHLMVSNPIKVIKDYISLKPNIITIHLESVRSKRQIKKIAKMIKAEDILFGLSIKPNTSVSDLVPFLDLIDLILIMSVEPGKSGQKFIESSLEKINDVKCLVGNRNIIIEVDGGINLDNYKKIISAGAEFLVMGSAFYNETDKSTLLYKIDKHYPKPKISK
jgi:ribulose-phosphate 3-epimerase